jgi:hypothetical protein
MRLDTTAGSVLHLFPRLFERLGLAPFERVGLYIGAVLLIYVPLLIGALRSPLSMTVPQGTLRMPFFYDVNTTCMCLVSFPCLLILTVTDQQVLTRALDTVQADGTITISEADGIALAKRWYRLFWLTNLAAQVLGLAVGGMVAYWNFGIATMGGSKGSWIVDDNKLLLAGYFFLYSVFLFYAVASVYVVRNVAIAFLFRDIVAHAKLHMLPLHPDKAGGLQPVGRLGLRNQYALTLLGLNVVLLVIVTYLFLTLSNMLIGLVVAAIVGYLIVGPLVFMAPLLPFRGGMLRNKAELMSKVALRMRMELDNLHSRLPSGAITVEDEQLIERLRKIGAVIDELPVWPFDAGTIRKFLSAYWFPIASGLSLPVGKAIVAILGYFNITIPLLK